MEKPKTPPKVGCQQNPSRSDCPLVCKYNHFESDDLAIDAWELKCLDCGWRDTVGFRSDEDEQDIETADEASPVCPTHCPFCRRSDVAPGPNPCGG